MPRPRGVAQSKRCPACNAGGVRVLTTRGGQRFWRCSRWPACPWASWRPRHAEDCPDCGAARFWSWSRKSVSCHACRRRWMVGPGGHHGQS